LSKNIALLKKYIKNDDTIKIYSKRISKDNCKIYIKTIQYMFYNYFYIFKMYYKDDIISYPNINELYIFKSLVNTDIYYKMKI